MDNLTLYRPGTKVIIGSKDEPIKGMITDLHVGFQGYVTYKVVWWDKRIRKHEWLERWEILEALAADDPEWDRRIQIGFQ